MPVEEDKRDIVAVEDISDYNRLFEQLVDADDSEHVLIGYVAYVRYKIAKREWVRNFCKNTNRHPSPADLKQYISTWTESRLTGVKGEANQILSAFADFVVEGETHSIEKRALQHRSFFREAGVACVGALFYTILLIGFALLLKVADIDAVSIFERVGVNHHDPTQQGSATNTPSPAAKSAR